jgi:very-short-patch-repair endonuclease/DNA polymerase III delta prime subunit
VSDHDISLRLNRSRRDLLDIGLRNNLINFRPGAKSLRIVDELSQEVADILCRRGRAMTFLALAEDRLAQLAADETGATEEGDEAGGELLLDRLATFEWGDEEEVAEGVARRHSDTRLQTLLGAERLFLTLLKIHNEAETSMQEQGVNTLFLALGFLHWYETDSADKVRRAPLILLPVQLRRVATREGFRLEYSGDDWVENLSLAAKMRNDFGLQLPPLPAGLRGDSDERLSFADYYQQVASAIAAQRRWRVSENEICLGFFSFGKFLMFNDLDPDLWPQTAQPADHAVLARLLGSGFDEVPPLVAEGEHLDSVITPGEVRFVRDADSSQVLAIIEARDGRNLVIQGPPGTGKSQTITNVIAELIGQGKRVLFVAEKMAALEVVKRRLDESHLGDAVLELHSHKTTRISLLDELRRTLEQGPPVIADSRDDLATLRELRDELNGYCEAVNQPIGESQVSFINALGHYLQLQRSYADLPVWPFAPMAVWQQRDQQRLRLKMEEVALQLAQMGQPDHHPFWSSGKVSFSPLEEGRLRGLLQRASDGHALLLRSAQLLATQLQLPPPQTLIAVAKLCRTAQRVATAPRLAGVDPGHAAWRTDRALVRQLLQVAAEMAALRERYRERLIEPVWRADLLEVRRHYATLGDRWWRIFSANFRRARATLQGFARQPLPTAAAAVMVWIDDVITYQQLRERFDNDALLGRSLFGSQWHEAQEDWPALIAIGDWITALHDEIESEQLPQEITRSLMLTHDINLLLQQTEVVERALAALHQLLGELAQQLEAPAATLEALPLEPLAAQLQLWQQSLPQLYHWVRYNYLRREMVEVGLAPFVEYVDGWHRSSGELVAAFDFAWFAGLVALGYASSPALAHFDATKHAHLIERFQRLDRQSLHHAQAALAHQIATQQPGINQPGEMAVIRGELNKKRRHKPIRQMMDEAGRAIQQIKPVFMMSPMSIANFLPPGKLEFDVVIFDEASQVKAVDAFGAILRGRQTIVVGDTRQMPPSDFFGRELDHDSAESETADIESILALFRARGVAERYLSWHYRSRHESLIAVSNVEFYDRRLVIFPSSGNHPDATGLTFSHLPDTLYERGKSRTNKGEAQAVAAAIMRHAAERPHLSLGVVAFSVAQRDLIQVELEILRRQQTVVEPFFLAAHPTEPFFIKNLENVQGDERDVIYISIGYGRNESGRIAREFGPLNREGGERRLNVLISRARLAMMVFCNFTAADLELDANASHGVRALKHFLHYAESGQLDIPRESGRGADSPFEREVKRALEGRGYRLESQVGTAGYFIDLAVKDPDFPGRYLLAIECDGASYHSARSARDRDRLRQGVLESLGWRFHRIWSTDWFRAAESEIDKAVAAIEAARQRSRTTIAAAAAQPAAEPPVAIISRLPMREAVAPPLIPYQRATLPLWHGSGALHEIGVATVAGMILEVVKCEAPLHEAVVTRRLLAAFQLTRSGSRIQEAIAAALRYGHQQQLFYYQSPFLYHDDRQQAEVRDRRQMEGSERKIEWVAPQEIEAALVTTIAQSFSITREEAVGALLDQLGFGRATANIAALVNQRIEGLIAAGRVAEVADRLRPVGDEMAGA